MLDRFITALRAAGLSPDAESVADFFFLASRLPTDAPLKLIAAEPGGSTGTVTAHSETNENAPRRISSQSAPRKVSESKGGLFARESTAEGTTPAAEIEVPEAPALPQSLEIARGLRAFSKQFRTPGIGPLDEEATAEQSAHLRRLVFVFRPTSERWFDLALLVEDTPSMAIWARTIDSFEKTLMGLGAFRDIRRWRLNADATLTDSSGKSSLPAALVSPNGRRIVLILTQGVSPAWQSNRFGEAIQRWAGRQPTAVIQLLPERLWENTNLGEPMLLARSPRPGLPNTEWELEFPSWMRRRMTGGVALPVLSLDAGSLREWAQMLMSKANTAVPAVFCSGLLSNPAQTPADPPADVSAEDRVDRFRRNASEQSFRLATALSAGPVTLPVLRLINQTLFGEFARQETLAEVVLGGLLYKAADDADPEQIYFDFHRGVRAALAQWAQSDDRFAVRRQVTRYLQAHPDTTQRFRVLVPRRGGKQRLPAWAEPFADESEALLRACGLLEEEAAVESEEATPVVDQVSPAPRRLAVLIGIDEYLNQVPRSRDCGIEVEVLASALKHRGFETTILLDEDATVTNLEAALEAAQERMTSNDFIWFHFSGRVTVSKLDGAQLMLRDQRSRTALFSMAMVHLIGMLRKLDAPILFTCGRFPFLPVAPLEISSIWASVAVEQEGRESSASLVSAMVEVIQTSDPAVPMLLAQFAEETIRRLRRPDVISSKASDPRFQSSIHDTFVLLPPNQAPESISDAQPTSSEAADREGEGGNKSVEDTSEENRKIELPDLRDGFVLYGRHEELAELDRAWRDPARRIVQIVGPAGAGKTILMSYWSRLHRGEARAFFWSFERNSSIESFFDGLGAFLEHNWLSVRSIDGKGFMLARKLFERRTVLLLDGLDSVLGPNGNATDPVMEHFLEDVASNMAGLVVVTTRVYWSGMSRDSRRASIYLSPFSDLRPALVHLQELESRAFDPGPKFLVEVLSEVLKTALAITGAEQAFYYSADTMEANAFTYHIGIDGGGEQIREDPNAGISILAEAAKGQKPISRRVFRPYMGSSESEVEASGALIYIPVFASDGAGYQELGVIYLEAASMIQSPLLPDFALVAGKLILEAKRRNSELARIREELALAHKQHQQLLDIPIPQIDFAEITVRFETSREIGGDFYDVVVSEGVVFVMLADVAGKGLASVAIARSLYDSIHDAFLRDEPLGAIATNLNQIAQTNDPARYAVMFLMRLTSAGALTYVNCGSTPPTLLRRGSLISLTASNIPIGLLPSYSFETGTDTFQPGDRLLILSDGISEAESPNGNMYFGDRLNQGVRSTSNLAEFLADWNAFREGQPVNDDWTAIEISFRGLPSQRPFVS